MVVRAISILLVLAVGVSLADDAHPYEKRLQTIARGQVAAALQHERNAKVLEAEEAAAVIEVIEAGLPFKVVLPETLAAGRYFDLEKKEALVRQSAKDRPRLLDNEGNPVDARVVRDKTTRQFLIQWDERALSALREVHAIPESLVQDVAHEAIRYAYHVGKIDRNDDSRQFSGKLFFPPPDEAIVLPSAQYRFDVKRRLRETIVRLQELIYFFETDLKYHQMAPLVLPGYKEDLATCLKGLRNREELTEELAQHMDNVERSLIQQRATVIEQINHGHLPVERPKKLDRFDFKARAAVLLEYASRVDDMIHWHHGLQDRKDAQAYLNKYQRLGVDYFLNFRREQWLMSDAELAVTFDGYERMLQTYVDRWRAEFPPKK